MLFVGFHSVFLGSEYVPSCPCAAGDGDAAKTGPHVVGHVRGLTQSQSTPHQTSDVTCLPTQNASENECF